MGPPYARLEASLSKTWRCKGKRTRTRVRVHLQVLFNKMALNVENTWNWLLGQLKVRLKRQKKFIVYTVILQLGGPSLKTWRMECCRRWRRTVMKQDAVRKWRGDLGGDGGRMKTKCPSSCCHTTTTEKHWSCIRNFSLPEFLEAQVNQDKDYTGSYTSLVKTCPGCKISLPLHVTCKTIGPYMFKRLAFYS